MIAPTIQAIAQMAKRVQAAAGKIASNINQSISVTMPPSYHNTL